MGNKLTLLGILNEAKVLPFKFNFSKLSKTDLDDLVYDITQTLPRGQKMLGSNSLEIIVSHASKSTNNLKNVIQKLLNNNVISKKEIVKILNESNPEIIDDIEDMLTGLTNSDDIARAKVAIRDKYNSQLKAIPADVAEEFIESNRIRFLRNSRKAFVSGFTSLKGAGLSMQVAGNFFKRIFGRNYTALTSEERKVLGWWLGTGVGNWVEVRSILRKSGAPKYMYAASHLTGQLVQKYLFWVALYSGFSFITNYAYDYFVPGKKYSTKSDAFISRVTDALKKGFNTIGIGGILPVSVIIKFAYENSQGGDFYESDVFKWIQISKVAMDAAAEALYAESKRDTKKVIKKVKKVIPKKVIPNNITPVDTTTVNTRPTL